MFNHVIDVLYVFDLFVKMRTLYHDRGYAVTAPKLVVPAYVHGGFRLDLLAALPFDQILMGFVDSTSHEPLLWLGGTLRLLRLRRCALFARSLDRSSNRNVIKILTLMLSFLLLAHWLGLGFLSVAIDPLIESGDSSQLWWWRMDSKYAAHLYVCGLYWALSVMTNLKSLAGTESRECFFENPHVPRPLAERVFTILVFLVGALFFSTIYGNIQVFVSRMNKINDRFSNRMFEVNEFIAFHGLTPRLADKIRNYVEFSFLTTKGINVDYISDQLPPYLQVPIAMQLNRRVLESVKIFVGCPRDFINALVAKLVPSICVVGDNIVNMVCVPKHPSPLAHSSPVPPLHAPLRLPVSLAPLHAYFSLPVLRSLVVSPLLSCPFPPLLPLLIHKMSILRNTARHHPLSRQGEMGNTLFFIRRGIADVLIKRNKVVATLHEGDYFGEIALIRRERRSANVRASTDCMLVSLSHNDLEECLKAFPHVRGRIQTAAAERLAEIRKVDPAWKGNPVPIAMRGLTTDTRRASRGAIAALIDAPMLIRQTTGVGSKWPTTGIPETMTSLNSGPRAKLRRLLWTVTRSPAALSAIAPMPSDGEAEGAQRAGHTEAGTLMVRKGLMDVQEDTSSCNGDSSIARDSLDNVRASAPTDEHPPGAEHSLLTSRASIVCASKGDRVPASVSSEHSSDETSVPAVSDKESLYNPDFLLDGVRNDDASSDPGIQRALANEECSRSRVDFPSNCATSAPVARRNCSSPTTTYERTISPPFTFMRRFMSNHESKNASLAQDLDSKRDSSKHGPNKQESSSKQVSSSKRNSTCSSKGKRRSEMGTFSQSHSNTVSEDRTPNSYEPVNKALVPDQVSDVMAPLMAKLAQLEAAANRDREDRKQRDELILKNLEKMTHIMARMSQVRTSWD